MGTPQVGILRNAWLAKETVLGTPNTTPDIFIPYRPPLVFSPNIAVIESKGIRAVPDAVFKAQQGPGTVQGMKMGFEVEPENIGQILKAAFGQDTITGTGPNYTHTFARTAVAQLPTYTIGADVGNSKFFQFDGSMLNKVDFVAKAKEFFLADTDWTATKYDDTGVTHATSYSVRKAFKWDQAVVTIGGSGNLIADNVKISIDNMVKAEHTLNSSIYPLLNIWSEGFRVLISFDLLFEDTTELAKFLAGTTSSLTLALSSTELIGGVPYSLTFTIPVVQYTAAPLHPPAGVIRIPFAGVAVYDQGGTNKTMSAVLINGVNTAY